MFLKWNSTTNRMKRLIMPEELDGEESDPDAIYDEPDITDTGEDE